MSEGSETATRALAEILRSTGYIRTNADFARLLRINPTNASAYMAQPGDTRRRVSPRIDTLAQWCWAISQTTGLTIRLVLDSSGELLFELSGHDASGAPIEERNVTTNYREVDQLPLPSWGLEWSRFLATYARFLVER